MISISYKLTAEQIALMRGTVRATPEPSKNPVTAKELQEPTLEKMVENFTEAMRDWKDAGFPVASLSTIADRRSVCVKCDFWDGKARLGLGKCNSPKCGCTRLKVFLQTSKCPEGKWAK